MTVRWLCLLLLLLLAGPLAQAQRANPEQAGAAGQANLDKLAHGDAAPLYLGRTDGVEGSPYLDDHWLPAQLTTDNQVPLAPVPLKYDVLNHWLLMRSATHDSLPLDDRHVVSFVLREPASAAGPARQRRFRRFAEAPNPAHRNHYAEVLHEGRYVLLKHYLKTVRKAPASSGYGMDAPAATLDDKTAYFLRLSAAETVPVKLTLKSLQSALPSLAGPLKSRGQAARTEADWVAILQQLDPR